MRTAILRGHLQDLSLRHPVKAQVLSNAAVIPVAGFSRQDANPGSRQPGGLTGSDISRFASGSPDVLDLETQRLLEEDLEATLRSLAKFYWGIDETPALELVSALRSQMEQMDSDREQIQKHRDRVEELIGHIEELIPKLHDHLAYAIQHVALQLRKQKSAEYQVLGATTEASILKLSLLRSRAHSDVYGYRDGEMSRALAQMSERHDREEEELAGEERELDAELRKYNQLLRLVDGVDGGFSQVVEDWAQVKQETDDCRRDLRRLGWTGD